MAIEKKRKMSYDIDFDNIETFEQFKRNNGGVSNSSLINSTIRTFFNLNSQTTEILNDACIAAYNQLNSETVTMGSMAFGLNLDTIDELSKIYEFLNNGASLKRASTQPKLVRHKTKDGTITIPSDWIYVDINTPTNCCYAGVVEVTNRAELNVPYFYFFTEQPAAKMSIEEQNMLFKKCCDLSETFKSAFDSEVQPIYSNGVIINHSEFMQSHKICIYEIPEAGSRGDNESNYPFGAMVYRNK